MKLPAALLFLGVFLLTGCRTDKPGLSDLERERFMVEQLYEKVWVVEPREISKDLHWNILGGASNEELLGYLYFPKFSHDPAWLKPVETILLRLADSTDAHTRRMVLPYLCGLGTESSIGITLEIAEEEGGYTVRVVDFIPYVPFTQKEKELTVSVREEMLEPLTYLPAAHAQKISEEMRAYLEHPNPEVLKLAAAFLGPHLQCSCQLF